MPDMLVKLYELPELDLKPLEAEGIKIKRAFAPDKREIAAWAEKHFSPYGAMEVEKTFTNTPISTFVAVHKRKLIGFACYNGTAPDFFGPTAVDPEYRGKGVGKALLLACLHALRNEGYYYAIIGGAGPTSFYEKSCGAVAIPDSEPGPYQDFLMLGEIPEWAKLED